MKYTYKIVFEADSDDEAQEVIWGNPDENIEGVNTMFDSIHRETLTREDGQEI